MPAIVVILPTSTYRASDFLRAAESLGVDLIVASEQPPPLAMGDGYLEIDCADPQAAATAIAELGNEVDIDGVIAADDLGVMVAAHASTMLGLRGNSPEAAAATRDKLKMRQRLARAEIDQPEFAAIGLEDDGLVAAEQVGLPVVLKPANRSASQGVIRVDRREDVAPTVRLIREIVGEDAHLLAESFMGGDEVAIEGIVRDGELTVLAVFDKPDTPTGPYFPETLFITPSRLRPTDIEEATRVAAAALRALGLDSGPVHVELKVSEGRARIIEVAARSIGGLCSRSLDFGLMGTSLETLILRNAIGLDKPGLRRQAMANGVLMIPTPTSGTLLRVTGEHEARAIPGVTGIDFTIKPGGRVVAPPAGDRYLGFVYARAESPEGVEMALRKAMETLEVQLEG